MVTKHKLELWQLKNSNCDNSKTKIVTKLKKIKLRLNLKTQIEEKKNIWRLDKVMKLVGGGSVINGAYPV